MVARILEMMPSPPAPLPRGEGSRISFFVFLALREVFVSKIFSCSSSPLGRGGWGVRADPIAIKVCSKSSKIF